MMEAPLGHCSISDEKCHRQRFAQNSRTIKSPDDNSHGGLINTDFSATSLKIDLI